MSSVTQKNIDLLALIYIGGKNKKKNPYSDDMELGPVSLAKKFKGQLSSVETDLAKEIEKRILRQSGRMFESLGLN